MDLVLGIISDQIIHADLAVLSVAEDRLHDRLRLRREEGRSVDDIRLALAACHARRMQILGADA